jgi:hypothetical protein
MRIDRQVDFETASDPVEKFFLALFNRGLDREVEQDKARSFFHLTIHLFQAVPL